MHLSVDFLMADGKIFFFPPSAFLTFQECLEQYNL